MSFFEEANKDCRGFGLSRCSNDFELHVLDRGVFIASLIDISQSGCRIMVDGAVHPEEFVMLEFTRNSAIDATIAWSQGSVAGCRFISPVSRATVQAVIDHCRRYGSSAYRHGDPDVPSRIGGSG